MSSYVARRGFLATLLGGAASARRLTVILSAFEAKADMRCRLALMVPSRLTQPV